MNSVYHNPGAYPRNADLFKGMRDNFREADEQMIIAALLDGVEAKREEYSRGNMFPFMVLVGELQSLAIICKKYPEMGKLLVQEMKKAIGVKG